MSPLVPKYKGLDVVAQVCDLCIWQTEVGKLWVQDWPGLHRVQASLGYRLCQKRKRIHEESEMGVQQTVRPSTRLSGDEWECGGWVPFFPAQGLGSLVLPEHHQEGSTSYLWGPWQHDQEMWWLDLSLWCWGQHPAPPQWPQASHLILAYDRWHGAAKFHSLRTVIWPLCGRHRQTEIQATDLRHSRDLEAAGKLWCSWEGLVTFPRRANTSSVTVGILQWHLDLLLSGAPCQASPLQGTDVLAVQALSGWSKTRRPFIWDKIHRGVMLWGFR